MTSGEKPFGTKPMIALVGLQVLLLAVAYHRPLQPRQLRARLALAPLPPPLQLTLLLLRALTCRLAQQM